jgi:quercetin dioxygenase-like cupin family protein
MNFTGNSNIAPISNLKQHRMAGKGQTISNAETGEIYEFLETASDTGGAYVKMKATITRKGELVPNHFHTRQDESFEVLSGQLTIWLNGKTTVLRAGDKLTLPKHIPHNHFNNEDMPVTYIHTVGPALDFEHLIESLTGLAIDGKSRNGRYGMMQALVFLRYLDSKTYVAAIPMGLQKILMHTVAPVGRLFGWRAVYRKYSGFEK